MRRNKHSKEEIGGELTEAKAGVKTTDPAQRHEMPEATITVVALGPTLQIFCKVLGDLAILDDVLDIAIKRGD